MLCVPSIAHQVGMRIPALALPLLTAPVLADTHYVSKTGSNTYPYDSWASAADTVARAVEAAAEWDTVLIAPGHFVTDTVRMKRGQVLRGAGVDSTILDTLPLAPGPYPMIAEDSCTISDFTMIQLPAAATIAMGATPLAVGPGISTGRDHSVFISRIRFDHINTGIHASFNDAARLGHVCIVSDCEFLYSQQAIVANFGGNIEVVRCSFINDRSASVGVVIADYSYLQVVNCRFYGYDPLGTNTNAAAISTVVSDPIVIRNNLFYSILEGEALDLNYNDGYSNSMAMGLVENNTIVGFQRHFKSTRPSWIFRNNISTRDRSTISTRPFYQGYATGEYNITWDNSPWDSGVVLAEDTIPNDAFANHDNYFSDPMFADTIAFLLQAYSPAIDAGDPSILDPDGSRSDIGYTGGPGGITYPFVDVPPAIPRSLKGAASDSQIVLIWRGNHEADFAGYELFRDSQPITSPDPGLLLTSIASDTGYVDSQVASGLAYFYRLRAVDNQGKASGLSNEVQLVATGVGDEHDPSLPVDFTVGQNYPNPFNGTTRIALMIHRPGPVRIVVYNVPGRAVAVLHDKTAPGGPLVVDWAPAGLGSGVYFVRIQSGRQTAVLRALYLK
jgi:hypothetical protein